MERHEKWREQGATSDAEPRKTAPTGEAEDTVFADIEREEEQRSVEQDVESSEEDEARRQRELLAREEAVRATVPHRGEDEELE